MNKEPENNIVHVCSHCTSERLQKAQEALKDPAIIEKINQLLASGKRVFAKFPFPVDINNPDGEAEHMWCRVIKWDWENEMIAGVLDNVPIYATYLECGDGHVMPMDKVESVFTEQGAMF